MKTTLTLRIPEEARKVLPWLIAAKAARRDREAEWLKGVFQDKLHEARERERRELEARERREYEERERQAELERLEEECRKWQEWWDKTWFNTHFYISEDGLEEFLPSQSSNNKGFRCFVSIHPRDSDKHRWGYDGPKQWTKIGHHSRRNHGRKPRRFRDYR